MINIRGYSEGRVPINRAYLIKFNIVYSELNISSSVFQPGITI